MASPRVQQFARLPNAFTQVPKAQSGKSWRNMASAIAIWPSSREQVPQPEALPYPRPRQRNE